MSMNTVCHIEFEVSDFDRSQAFYEAVFGWQFRDFGPMRVFGAGDQHVGGLSKGDPVKPMAFTSVWIQVADVKACIAKAAGSGGKVLRDKYDIPEVGWGAELVDPDGNPIGLVQFPAK